MYNFEVETLIQILDAIVTRINPKDLNKDSQFYVPLCGTKSTARFCILHYITYGDYEIISKLVFFKVIYSYCSYMYIYAYLARVHCNRNITWHLYTYEPLRNHALTFVCKV